MATTHTPQSNSGHTPVSTKKVTGRRYLRYDSYDDFLADAERMAAVPTRTLGNWSLSQIFDHLGKSILGMIDGLDFSLPAPIRMVMRLLMMRRMLTRTLPAGFQIPKSGTGVIPTESDVEAGLQRLREAVARAKSEPGRAKHPAFGNFSRQQWDQFQLRHCEMHMSFVVPLPEAAV